MRANPGAMAVCTELANLTAARGGGDDDADY